MERAGVTCEYQIVNRRAQCVMQWRRHNVLHGIHYYRTVSRIVVLYNIDYCHASYTIYYAILCGINNRRRT